MIRALDHPWVNTRPLSLTTDSDRSLFAWSSNVGRADAAINLSLRSRQGDSEPRRTAAWPTAPTTTDWISAGSESCSSTPNVNWEYSLGYRRTNTKKASAGVKRMRLRATGMAIQVSLSRDPGGSNGPRRRVNGGKL